jgi:RNA recognition motif-containing protein
MEPDFYNKEKEKKSKIKRMIMNIYVGNLSYHATEETIRQAFESFGQVISARIIKDKYDGQSKGFGFVEMLEQSQAQAAIKSFNGKELLGKQINVNEARPRTDQGRSGGQGGRMDYSGRKNRY